MGGQSSRQHSPFPEAWAATGAEVLDVLSWIVQISDQEFLSAPAKIPELESSNWTFESGTYVQCAEVVMQDKAMAMNRLVYRMVPRKVSEDEFWRLFFCNAYHALITSRWHREEKLGFMKVLVDSPPHVVKKVVSQMFEALPLASNAKIMQSIEQTACRLMDNSGPETIPNDLQMSFAEVLGAADPRVVKLAACQLLRRTTPADYASVLQPLEEMACQQLLQEELQVQQTVPEETSRSREDPDRPTVPVEPVLTPQVEAEQRPPSESTEQVAPVELEREAAATRFETLKIKFAASAVRDMSGVQQDVSMAEFFDACDLYRDILSKLGSAVGFVLRDIDHNLTESRSAFLAKPEERKTMKAFLQPLHPGSHAGIPKIMWLLRGLEFFLVMIQLLFEGDGSKGAVEAYSKTLMQYHGWMLQSTVKVGMRAMPSRDTISRSEGLCLGSPPPERCQELCMREAPGAAQAALEQVHFMMDLMKKSGHWDSKKA